MDIMEKFTDELFGVINHLSQDEYQVILLCQLFQ